MDLLARPSRHRFISRLSQRRISDGSTAGICELPRNILAANLVDIVRHSSEVQGQTKSGASNTENRQLCTLDTDECSQPATVYCDACDVYMCEQCELSHKKSKFTRKHQIIAVTQAKSKPKKMYCSKHMSKLLDIFCEDCNESICSVCLFKEHKKHKCCALEEKMDDLGGQLDQGLGQTFQSLNVKVEVDNVKNDQQRTTVNDQSLTRGVRQLNTFITQCEVRGMVSYHNHLLVVHRGDDKLNVYDERGMLKRSIQISSPDKSCVMRCAGDMCLVHDERDTHSLVISDVGIRRLWWLTIDKQAGDVALGQPHEHKLDYDPCGISTDRSGRVVVADYINSHNRVYVYSHPGQQVSCLQMSGAMRPLQALADQSHGYVVRCSSSKQLLWVNSSGQVTHRYSDQPAVNADHILDDGTDILVSDSENHCVHIVTRWGRHDGHLITDLDPTCVCLDPAGRRLWVAYKGNDNNRHVMEMSYTPRTSDGSPALM